ncbi:MAG: ApaG domain [Saprospiraceae bacterium]|nr:ApaG domain [Saprospiraceae bacterium]
MGAFTVQLLNRHWFILIRLAFYARCKAMVWWVNNLILQPGESYNYQSWSNLSTELGKMYGYYTMRETARKQQFKALIPEFDLIAPFKLN